nr:uncharacterized protein [uncultured bacterium]
MASALFDGSFAPSRNEHRATPAAGSSRLTGLLASIRPGMIRLLIRWTERLPAPAAASHLQRNSREAQTRRFIHLMEKALLGAVGALWLLAGWVAFDGLRLFLQ